MKWVARLQIALAVLVIVSLIARGDTAKQSPEKAPPPAALEPIDGHYACDGWQDGEEGLKPYSGVCTIRKVKGVFVVTWAIGNSSFTGVGLMKGDTFSVGWCTENGKARGVNVYLLKGDGSLEGHWVTIPSTLKAQPESLKLLRKLARTKGDV